AEIWRAAFAMPAISGYAASSSCHACGRSERDTRCSDDVVGSARWYGSGWGSGVTSPDERRLGSSTRSPLDGDDGRGKGSGDGLGTEGGGDSRPGGDCLANGSGDGSRGRGSSRGAAWLAISAASSSVHGPSFGASSRMLRHTVIACC